MDVVFAMDNLKKERPRLSEVPTVHQSTSRESGERYRPGSDSSMVTSGHPGLANEAMVSISLPKERSPLAAAIQQRGGYWDARRSVWRLSRRVALELGLEHHLV